MAFPLLAVPPIIEGALALTALAMATSITLQNYMDASPRLPKDKGLEPPITPSVDEGFSIDDGGYKTYEGSYPELDEQTKKILSEEEFKTPVSEDMSILTSSINEWADSLGYTEDNPGKKYIEDKKAHRIKQGEDVDSMFLPTTAYFSKGKIDMPVDWLIENSKGGMGEREGDWSTTDYTIKNIENLADSMKKDGYTGGPIMTIVSPLGNPVISEGNHRLMAAKMAGLKTIPSSVQWLLGSESKEFVPDTKLSIIDLYKLVNKEEK